MQIWASYARVSRQGSREDERLRSPEFQHAANRGWAQREGVGLREYPAEIDVSGSKAKRVELDRIIADVERGELAGIVVARLDRLSRLAPRDRLELFERIRDAGGVVRSASENIDDSTPEGRFALEVFLGVARMQWERYAQGFSDAKANAIAEGIAIMSRAPFGLRFTERHGLEPEPGDAAILLELFELRAGEASYDACLHHFEQATGRRSSRATMQAMLRNRVYLGELHYGAGAGALVNATAHAAIVPSELFEAVQEVNERRSSMNPRASNKAKSLLAGIARCAGCGRGLIRSRTGGGRSLSYKCPSDRHHCSARAQILARDLDGHVVAQVLAWVGPAADELVELEAELEASGNRVVVEHRLEQARARLLEWSADVELEEREPEAYKQGRHSRLERIWALEQRLAALGEASELEAVRSTLRTALAGDDADVDERRRLLAVALETVIVRRTPYRGAPIDGRVELRFGGGGPPKAPLPALAQD